MPTGSGLKRKFTKAIGMLKASAKDVYIRTYTETGGHPESGMPPVRTPSDIAITPRPAVLPADAKTDALELEAVETAQVMKGDLKVVMDADQPVEAGTILHIGGADYSVYRLETPALFGCELVKVALARMVER